MTRKLLQCTLTTLVFFFAVNIANAQNPNKNDQFIGTWEFVKYPPNDTAKRTTPFFTTLKFFSTDSSCTQVRVTEKGAYVQQKGKFSVIDHEYFNDILLSSTTNKEVKLEGKTYKVKYEFKADDRGNKYVILQGVLEGQNGLERYSWKELWRKVEVIKQ
ncbi:MAG TPA: hypothetical protein VL088_03325 [Pedobacter sp.]|nr:hypothetical protein [Pedobacter sp.]